MKRQPTHSYEYQSIRKTTQEIQFSKEIFISNVESSSGFVVNKSQSKIIREQTEQRDDRTNDPGRPPEQQPNRKNNENRNPIHLLIFLIIIGPVIINGVVQILNWYLGAPLYDYLGFSLSADQINLIVEKVLDVVIFMIWNKPRS